MFLNVRKERVHHCGHSNIDFRSNNSEFVSKFVNAKNKIDFIAASNNFPNSEENNSSSNFAKSPRSNKKIILKLPFHDHRKIKKISEAIEKSNEADIEKAIDPKFSDNNPKNFFKIISPIKTNKISDSINFDKLKAKKIIKENENFKSLNGKVDAVIPDIRDSYSIENEFSNKNNVIATSNRVLNINLKNGLERDNSETPSKIIIFITLIICFKFCLLDFFLLNIYAVIYLIFSLL